MSIGQSGEVDPGRPEHGHGRTTQTLPVPARRGLDHRRVPSDELTGMVRELSALGEVTASSVNRQDVTEQTVDLEARSRPRRHPSIG